MWLKEIFQIINEYPWTSLFVGIWIIICLTIMFIEKDK
jgi:hypothetical protein